MWLEKNIHHYGRCYGKPVFKRLSSNLLLTAWEPGNFDKGKQHLVDPEKKNACAILGAGWSWTDSRLPYPQCRDIKTCKNPLVLLTTVFRQRHANDRVIILRNRETVPEAYLWHVLKQSRNPSVQRRIEWRLILPLLVWFSIADKTDNLYLTSLYSKRKQEVFLPSFPRVSTVFINAWFILNPSCNIFLEC